MSPIAPAKGGSVPARHQRRLRTEFSWPHRECNYAGARYRPDPSAQFWSERRGPILTNEQENDGLAFAGWIRDRIEVIQAGWSEAERRRRERWSTRRAELPRWDGADSHAVDETRWP